MISRTFPRLLALSLACAAGALAVAPVVPLLAEERPNIVWIVSEDNSVHYLALFEESGGSGAETPHIAALAEEGILFTRAFSNSPVCSVARTTLATGSYAPRLGTQYHRRSRNATLPEGLMLFSSYLTEAGYHTTNNSKKDYNCVESPSSWIESSRTASWRDRPDPAQPFFHFESHTASHEGSLHFSEEDYRSQPPRHDPGEVALPPYFPDTPLFRYTFARYLDNIVRIDEIVGETVAKLEEDGLLENTFVFYFGDHGGVLPRSKGYLYESGLHVPLVVRVPENFRHLVDLEPGSRHAGFVEFVDFGPTVLHLAGLPVPDLMDGEPFLGEEVSLETLASRDTAFGYADRFDEKYEMVRSLRVGDWKYIRSFQPYYPDALHNNYRYQMLAFREWRDLYLEGKLGSFQRLFFEPKPAELLFDLSTDPHEVVNLAEDPDHRERLLEMREALSERLRELPDLSFLPENVLYDEGLDDPLAYGEAQRERIERLQTVADLMLVPMSEADEALRDALASDDPLERYWAATVCAAAGEGAEELVRQVEPLLEDEDPAVRVRATEFLTLVGRADPRKTLVDLVNGTEHRVEQLIALNAAALFHSQAALSYPFAADSFITVDPETEAQRRLDYFAGEWLRPRAGRAAKGGKGKGKGGN